MCSRNADSANPSNSTSLHFLAGQPANLSILQFASFRHVLPSLMMVAATRSSALKKSSEMKTLVATAIFGVMLGIVIGITSTKYGLVLRVPLIEIAANSPVEARHEAPYSGAELLPPGIVVPTTDLFTRRLWGNPDEDISYQPKYLVTFTVGFDQRDIVNAAVSKFSKNWTIVLFHYDGRINEWDQFEWAQKVIHISAKKQTKWWFAKRFLHPDIVAPFEYIFIWDEDLGVEHFDAEEYIRLVKKHGLEISQPGLEPNRGLTWQMTKRLGNSEVHKSTEERPGWCQDPKAPPCAGFVEIMAPVFSKSAWRCVWHMIQNDLVHGWGLDFALGRCVQPPHEKIGVVDAQYIVHKVVPSLGNQGESLNGRAPWEGVRQRCNYEWQVFRERMKNAENARLMSKKADNSTTTPEVVH